MNGYNVVLVNGGPNEKMNVQMKDRYEEIQRTCKEFDSIKKLL